MPEIFTYDSSIFRGSLRGLYYYRARYYNPILGRFIQPDTIVQNTYDPQSWNRYSYVRNNPLKYVDPSGHNSIGVDENGDPVVNVTDPYGKFPDQRAPSSDPATLVSERYNGNSNGEGNLVSYDCRGGRCDLGSDNGPSPANAGEGARDAGVSRTAQREEGGLVGAAVSEGGGSSWSSTAGMVLTTGELARQYAAFPTFGRSIQSVEGALKSGNFAHTSGRVYSQAFRGNQHISSASIDLSKNVGKVLKWGGRGLLGASIVVAIMEFGGSDMSGADYARLGGSLAITVTGGVPYVGPILSIGLGYADSLGVFDRFYNWFDR